MYLRARVATIKSVTADCGSFYQYLLCTLPIVLSNTHLLVLGDDVLEEGSVNDGIVPLLLHGNTVDLSSLDIGGSVVGVHLLSASSPSEARTESILEQSERSGSESEREEIWK